MQLVHISIIQQSLRKSYVMLIYLLQKHANNRQPTRMLAPLHDLPNTYILNYFIAAYLLLFRNSVNALYTHCWHFNMNMKHKEKDPLADRLDDRGRERIFAYGRQEEEEDDLLRADGGNGEGRGELFDDDGSEGLNRKFRGAAVDYDVEPFARVDLRTPNQVLEVPQADEGNIAFKFTPSARDSQLSQPQDDRDFMQDREAVFLTRKPKLTTVLQGLDDEEEDILDEPAMFQRRPKPVTQTSGQLIDAEFLEDDFQRHSSFKDRVTGENEVVMAQIDPMKKCISQLSRNKQMIKSKEPGSGEKKGLDGVNRQLTKSKGRSSIDDSLNQRVSNPSLDFYHPLFGPSQADGLEQGRRSDPFNGQSSPAANASSGGQNFKTETAGGAIPSPAVNKEFKNAASPSTSKNRPRKDSAKFALNQSVNQGHGPKARALAAKLATPKAATSKPKPVTQTTRNASAKTNNFFRSPKQKVEHTKPNQKVVKASIIVERTEGSEKNNKNLENVGETGQTFNNIFSNENFDDVNGRADSEEESPGFARKSIKKKRNSAAVNQAKNATFGSKARASTAAGKKTDDSVVKDADQGRREITSESGQPRKGDGGPRSSLDHSKLEEGVVPQSPKRQSTPKHANVSAAGHVRSTPTGQHASLSKMRKQSIMQKQQALRMSKARDFLESQTAEQKAKVKPKALRGSPQSKNAPISTKFSSLRGARGSGSGIYHNVQALLSPQAAQYASKLEKSTAAEGSRPVSGSASASANKSVAQKLAAALRRQPLKGSPQFLRTDPSRPLQRQLPHTQEKRKRLLQDSHGPILGSEQKVTHSRNAPAAQYSSAQPSTTKLKPFLKPKIQTSPDQIARLRSLRGSTSNGSSSVKKAGNLIRLKATNLYTSKISQAQADLDPQANPVATPQQPQPAERDAGDTQVEQARQLMLKHESSLQEIKITFLDKVGASGPKARQRNPIGDLGDPSHNADISQSQEHALKQINVSDKNNKRKEAKEALGNLEGISEFGQQDGLYRLRRRQQQSEHQQSLLAHSQLSISKVVEGKLSANTAEALKMNTQFTGDEEDVASVSENKKVVETLGDLLGVFGVRSYDRNDFSFSHGGAKYWIDVGKLVRELGGDGLTGGPNSAASKLSLGSRPQLNSALADLENQQIAVQDIDTQGYADLNAFAWQAGPKTPNEKFLGLMDPSGAANKGIGTENPVQGARNLLNTDRLWNNGQHALNPVQNNSQRVLVPPMQLDPAAAGRSKNPGPSAPSAGETDALVHKLNPKRMRSATNHKSCRSYDQSSTGRPISNYSKGFQQVRDQHQDRLKLSRLRTNSRQQIQQRMKSNDPNDLRHDSKSNQGSFVGSVQKQETLDPRQPSLQVKHLQTEAQASSNQHPLLGVQQFDSKSHGLLDPNNIPPHRSQDPATQSAANQARADGLNAFHAGPTLAIQDGTISHPDHCLSPQNAESNPPLEPASSAHPQSSQNSRQQQPEQIHLAFLFASPLMLKTSDNSYFDVLPPISFEDEFEQIKQSIEEKKIQFNYRYQVATSVNLLKILRENPVGLHFSGHGFKNTEVIYEGDKKAWKKNQNKGDVLIFENEDGSSEFFFQNDLDKMFKNVAEQLNRLNAQKEGPEAQRQDQAKQEDGGEEKQLQDFEKTLEKLKDRPTNLQFVFVASCHAEKVAEIFLKIGVPHVICINQNQRILDKAAVDFSKFFYDEVFDKFCTICEAYANAKQQLENIYGPFHANKILLKTFDGHEVKNCVFKDHRQQRKHGFLKRLDEESVLNYFPNKVSPFLFRNRDMFDVLKLLTEHKIVQIFGLPGLGKSSLLKNVAVYLGERNYYKEGLIYIDLRHITTFQEALKIVSLYLNQGVDNEHDQFQLSFNPDHAFNEMLSIKRILGPLKHFMFAFDNIDHLEKNEYNKFLQFMIELSQNTKVKFLFTSERYQPSLFQGDIGVKLLKRLTHHESVELFLTKIPLSDTDRISYFEFGNIKELHEQTAKFYADFGIKKDLPKICALRNCPHTFSACVKKYLLEHPMFEFFMGTPLVISIVAPFTVCKSLKEICIDLWQRSKEQSSSADGENIMSTEILQDEIYYQSLLDSLDYCTKHFQEQGQEDGNSPILEMWYIIGLNGPGILQEDLRAIICAGNDQIEARPKQAKDEQNPFLQFERNLEDLTKFSVIESENVDVAGRAKRLKVGPMINDYINRKLDKKFKETTLQIVCVQIRDVLVELKKTYSDEVVKCTHEKQVKQREDALADKIKLYEQQIMHLVYQAIKMGKADDDDGDSLLSDESMDEKEQRKQEEMLGGGTPVPESQKGENTAQLQRSGTNKPVSKVQHAKSMRSTGKKPRKQNHEVKPHVSKGFRDLRMTLKHRQIGLRVDDDDADCDVDQGQDFKMLGQEPRAGSEILKNQVRPVRQMGPSARDNANNKAQPGEKKGEQGQPGEAVEGPFEKPKEAATQPQEQAKDPKGMGKPEIHHDLLPIREVSDDQIVLSLQDRSEDRLDSIFEAARFGIQELRDYQQNPGQQPGAKSPRTLITASRRHQPFEPSDSKSEVEQADAKEVAEQPSYRRSAVDSDEQPYQWEDSSQERDAEGGKAPEQTQEAEDQDEPDLLQKDERLSSFLVDHQKVMAEDEEEETTDAHHFNNTVSPAELAKQLNQRLFPEGNDQDFESTLRRLTWKNLASRLANEEPDRKQHKILRKRQNTLLKKLDPIKYDVNESKLFRIRQSVLENSFSKNNKQLINQLNNPDIGKQPQELGEPPEKDPMLETIPEQPSLAPEKECEPRAVPTLSKNKSYHHPQGQQQHPRMRRHTEVEYRGSAIRAPVHAEASASCQHVHNTSAPAKQSGYKQEKQYELQIHEELFFHYLSILALVPKERPKILVILDTFKTRNYQPQDEPASLAQNDEARHSKKSTFNIMQSEAQKKLIDFKTFIEIPEKSKLLRANTLMLELYVQINEDMMALMDYMNIDTGVKQPSQVNRRLDPVYEKASEIRPFFEEIQFVRGLAMLDYVQAMRKLQRNKNLREFKQKIKSSALKFEQVHDSCGIQQCIELAKHALKVKPPAEPGAGPLASSAASLQKRQLKSDTQDLEDNLKCIQALELRLQNLADCSDHQVQRYVRYRQENKIPNLAAILKPKGIQVDKVLNMLLNPQCHLTMTKEI